MKPEDYFISCEPFLLLEGCHEQNILWRVDRGWLPGPCPVLLLLLLLSRTGEENEMDKIVG